jgi:hypothetical protein
MHRIEGAQTEREVCLILPYFSSFFQQFAALPLPLRGILQRRQMRFGMRLI